MYENAPPVHNPDKSGMIERCLSYLAAYYTDHAMLDEQYRENDREIGQREGKKCYDSRIDV